MRDSLPLRKQITFRVNTRPGAGRRVLPVGNACLAKRSLDSEYEINPLRMQQGGNGGAKRRRFPRVA
jgi:hypothetical protein